MNIDAKLLKILVCPQTKQPVSLATPELLSELNKRIARGEIRNHAGEVVAQQLDGGLLRNDGRVIYPVINNIPIMLVDDALIL